MAYILIRGGGDLATGVALRLLRSGFKVIMLELAEPLAVRRSVSLSEAIYSDETKVEGVQARRADTPAQAFELAQKSIIPILVDPQATLFERAVFRAVVDARLMKHSEAAGLSPTPLLIGLGPGFTCDENCHIVIETQRGHYLGRVYWSGSARADTGQPEGDPRRVLRAPRAGKLIAHVEIGEHVQAGQLIAEIADQKITAPMAGVLRGLIHPGIAIAAGIKIGDIDPRDEPAYCFTVSDKALAVGGGVLEALLAHSILPESA